MSLSLYHIPTFTACSVNFFLADDNTGVGSTPVFYGVFFDICGAQTQADSDRFILAVGQSLAAVGQPLQVAAVGTSAPVVVPLAGMLFGVLIHITAGSCPFLKAQPRL